jgi:predicted nucleic acid-binding Zn ribbon protein
VQPVRLDRKILTVAVDDPAWATQVQLLHDELLARVVAASGVELDGIEVRMARRSRWR